MKIKPTPGQLVRNAGRTLYRMALITRVWQSKSTCYAVEVAWTYYAGHPQLIGTTTQIDSRHFGKMDHLGTSSQYGYVIVQREDGDPTSPRNRG